MFSIGSGSHKTLLAVAMAAAAVLQPRLALAADPPAVTEQTLLAGDAYMKSFHYEVATDPGSPGQPARYGPVQRVYVTGPPGAPPIVLLHELPGLRDGDIQLGERLGKTFRVWVPLMFGLPGQDNGNWGKKQACATNLFACHSQRASHMILSSLHTVVTRACGTSNCAVIGMCLTGSFPLSLIKDAPVVALVLAQPSLPFPRWWNPITLLRRGIDISTAETADAMKVASERRADVFMIRFHGDLISSHRSFRQLQERIRATPGILLTCREEHGHFFDHSSLVHDKDHPDESNRRFDTLLAFLKGRLLGGVPPGTGGC